MKKARRVQGSPQHIENIRYMSAIEHHSCVIPKSKLPTCPYRDIYGICRLVIGSTKSKFCGQLCKHYKCSIIHYNLNHQTYSCIHFDTQKKQM